MKYLHLFFLLFVVVSCENSSNEKSIGLLYKTDDLNNKLTFISSIYDNINKGKYSTDVAFTSKLKVCFNCVSNEEKFNADVDVWEHLKTLGEDKLIHGFSDKNLYEVCDEIINNKKEKDEYDYTYTNRLVSLKYLFVVKVDTMIEPKIIEKGDAENYMPGTFSAGLIAGNVFVFDLDSESYLGLFSISAQNNENVTNNFGSDQMNQHSLDKDLMNSVKTAITAKVELLEYNCRPII